MKELKASLTNWWGGLSLRERRLTLGGSFVLFIGIIYWGVFQPLNDRAELSQSRLAGEKQLYAEVTKTANDIIVLRGQGGSGGAARSSSPLNQIISETSKRYNIELIRMQPRDEMLQVWVQPLSFNALVNWLATLKDREGIRVQNLDIKISSTPGMVEVNRLQFTR